MDWLRELGVGIASHAAGALLAAIIAGAAVWMFSNARLKLRERQAHLLTSKAIQNARDDLRREYRQKYEAALPALARSLAKMILEPIDFEKIESRARAIVQTRDEMRATITNLHMLLNTEIDRLSDQLLASEKDKKDRREDIRKTIETLQYSWKEGKVERIEIMLRRLLAENGLAEILDDDAGRRSEGEKEPA